MQNKESDVKNQNCPNCGAPYDIHEMKCPYCGTKYIDFTHLDLDSREPIFIKMRARRNGKTVVFLQRCIPTAANMEVHNEFGVDVSDLGCDYRFTTNLSPQINTNIEFVTVPMNDGTMYHIIVEN